MGVAIRALLPAPLFRQHLALLYINANDDNKHKHCFRRGHPKYLNGVKPFGDRGSVLPLRTPAVYLLPKNPTINYNILKQKKDHYQEHDV